MQEYNIIINFFYWAYIPPEYKIEGYEYDYIGL